LLQYLLVYAEQTELWDHKARKDLRVFKGFKGLKAKLAQQGHRAIRDRKGFKGHQVRKARRVSKGRPVLLDHRGFRGRQVQRVQLALRVQLVRQVRVWLLAGPQGRCW